jgi:hypothetical protein
LGDKSGRLSDKRPVAYSPHRALPAPMPRRRPSLESDARHQVPVVIFGFAEYGIIFVYKPAVFSVCLFVLFILYSL